MWKDLELPVNFKGGIPEVASFFRAALKDQYEVIEAPPRGFVVKNGHLACFYVLTYFETGKIRFTVHLPLFALRQNWLAMILVGLVILLTTPFSILIVMMPWTYLYYSKIGVMERVFKQFCHEVSQQYSESDKETSSANQFNPSNKDKLMCQAAVELGFVTQESANEILEEAKVDSAIGTTKPLAGYFFEKKLLTKEQIAHILKKIG